MPVRVGILIIGSLYWRMDGRIRWRKCRLQEDVKWLVQVAIRYGRYSGQAPNRSYTMVFGGLPDTPSGQALVVPCKKDVATPNDLVKEAEWLWGAEQNHVPTSCSSAPASRISPDGGWGCVALLSNPTSTVPPPLLAEWANRVAREGARYNVVNNSRRLVDAHGRLLIPWPTLLDGSPVPLDLLLATANDPADPYPTVQKIAEAWKQHPEVEYFRPNRQHGIHTFEDAGIEKLLP